MNADKLATELHLISSQKKDLLDKSVAMLRQQQAELDVLKERNRFLESFYRTVKAQEK
jgi:cell division protein FtsB